MATKVQLTVTQRELNKHLSVQDEVQDAVESVARKIYTAAVRDLAAHRKTGDHQIEISRERDRKYGHIDWYVSMTGTNAAAVEFGHYTPSGDKWVSGLHIIGVAMFSARF